MLGMLPITKCKPVKISMYFKQYFFIQISIIDVKRGGEKSECV